MAAIETIVQAQVSLSNTALLSLTDELITQNCLIRFRATGKSMHPTIRDGEAIVLQRSDPTQLREGDIVLSRQEDRLFAHRIVKLTKAHGVPTTMLLRGDAMEACDLPLGPGAIVAKVVAVERRGQLIDLDSRRAKAAFTLRRWLLRGRLLGPFGRATVSFTRKFVPVCHRGTLSHLKDPT
jgi:hypothetical protein